MKRTSSPRSLLVKSILKIAGFIFKMYENIWNKSKFDSKKLVLRG